MEPKDVILGNVPGARCPGISVMEPKDVILGNVLSWSQMSRHLCHGAERRDTRERSRSQMSRHLCHGAERRDTRERSRSQMSRHLCHGVRCPGISVMEPDVQASLSWSRKT